MADLPNKVQHQQKKPNGLSTAVDMVISQLRTMALVLKHIRLNIPSKNLT